jgi:hypothetical protein
MDPLNEERFLEELHTLEWRSKAFALIKTEMTRFESANQGFKFMNLNQHVGSLRSLILPVMLEKT